jgi:para-nitrobenzyl esterase
MLGACHAIDLPFTFGNIGIEGMELFAGKGEPVARLAGDMMDAWAAFARTGDPNHAGLPAWPRYEPGRRGTMVLGPSYAVADAPMEAERACWGE